MTIDADTLSLESPQPFSFACSAGFQPRGLAALKGPRYVVVKNEIVTS
jgi:hypothetical protein